MCVCVYEKPTIAQNHKPFICILNMSTENFIKYRPVSTKYLAFHIVMDVIKYTVEPHSHLRLLDFYKSSHVSAVVNYRFNHFPQIYLLGLLLSQEQPPANKRT